MFLDDRPTWLRDLSRAAPADSSLQIDSMVLGRGEMNVGDPRLPTRFWAKVRIDASGCWLWTAHKDRDGYGRFKWEGRQRFAHRVSCDAERGSCADSETCSHLCHVRACVNPAHIVYEAIKANVDRSVALRLTCPRGHAYDIVAWPSLPKYPRRYCGQCNNEAHRIRYQRKQKK